MDILLCWKTLISFMKQATPPVRIKIFVGHRQTLDRSICYETEVLKRGSADEKIDE